jgi:hypothetical protein
MKQNIAKKNRGRPSKGKTRLAVLRAKITVPAEHKGRFLKRKGHYEVETKTLPVSTVAEWLNVSDDTLRSIERGRPGYPFKREHAETIMHQTHASLDWLLGDGDKNKPINFLYRPYSQSDFDRAQADIKRTGYPVLRAQAEFKGGVAALATILMQACKRGEIDTFASKLTTSFRDFFAMFPKSEPFVDFGKFIDQSTTSITAPDFAPLLNEWEKQLVRIAAQRQQAKPANPTRR